ncbi:hypothetical protein SAMN03159448_06184 [Sinorhizobium sp. NFACC03]|nr:hypothetical protein SAMN03159448_06184 [Sinorhizobium sp. NFACC03]
MLVVETIAKIRRLALVQGKSIKAICRELGISRKVVRKVLRTDETEFKHERTRQPQPKLGPWRDQLDQLLLNNEAKASRERLTLIRIFEDLRKRGRLGGGLFADVMRDLCISRRCGRSESWVGFRDGGKS